MKPEKPNTTKFFPSGVIGIAAATSTREIHRRAKAGKWPMRYSTGREFLYAPPSALIPECKKLTEIINHVRKLDGEAPVTSDVAATGDNRAEAIRVARRICAVVMLLDGMQKGERREPALERISKAIGCNVTARSIRRWFLAFEKSGAAGLLEHNRSVVGRKRKGNSCR